MDEYIRRRAALSEACKGCGIDFPCEPCEPQDCEIKARLQAIPAADVVDVVRCRDCKHRTEDCFCTGRGWPMQLVADDGFCEKGKPKDGGQEE